MICVSIGERSLPAVQRQLKRHLFVEVRIDLVRPKLEDLRLLIPAGKSVIATCRPCAWNDRTRLRYLLEAIEVGARYVDVELESPPWLRKAVASAAAQHGCELIISYHDHKTTPSEANLRRIVRRAFGQGADIVKVACLATAPHHNALLLGLLKEPAWRGKLVVLGMGTVGRITRIAGPLLGSPFTYASAATGKETAPGQVSAHALKRIWKDLGWNP